MRRAAVAYPAFAVALAVSWLMLLLWAAGADWRAPLTPANERQLPGSRFHAVFGRATPVAQRLAVEAAAADFSALQATQLPELDAADFPVLRYRFADFPRTLELSLVFRTAENPGDVQTISLPWPGAGTSTFDLSRVPGWQGTLIELGFAEFATAQNVPPELGFHPFELVRAELWSPSWQGALAALVTDWFGAWPWSQRSVHALGREGNAPHARSAELCVALAVACAVGWGALLLGLRGRRLAGLTLAMLALAWVALDLRWQTGLVHRLLATRTLYAGTEWPARARIVGDDAIERAAEAVRTLLAGEPAQTRVLVYAGTGYEWLRLIWHLLPLNAGALPLALSYAAPIPDGSVIVFYQSDAWRRNPALRRLLAHSRRVHADGVVMAEGFENDPLIVFRYHDAP